MDDRLPLFEQLWPEGDYRFFQLGFVVDDLVDVARRWVAVFGVGPFHVLPVRPAPAPARPSTGEHRAARPAVAEYGARCRSS